MKTIAAVAFIVAFTVAEPPPSNSYLPPPSNRGAGYPQGPQSAQLPQVIAARTANQPRHGAGAGGFARSSAQPGAHGHGHAHGQGPAARFADDHHGQGQGYDQGPAGYDHGPGGYDQNAAALARNALEQANAEPANYNFGYMVNDYHEGTDFGHHEARQEERAEGEYHVVLPDGRKQTVSYEADERGFKPQISYEDTEDLARSGYNSNANNFRAGSHGNDHHGGHGSHGNARANNGY